ncbi:MAG: precorrin-2 dehydrogenase/sirohydrochlorin ferrochelatase family protein [Flavobacteriaceae bacterium]
MSNELYPIFLKTQQLRILIVGGGYVALEKLTFLFKSSPNSQVTVLSPMLRPETETCMNAHGVKYISGVYDQNFLSGFHLAIATTDQPKVNQQVFEDCRKRNILVNVADNPPLCDFYMGSIVTKGNLKVGISTNGKSPTFAKRFRQWLEAFLPEEIDEMLNKLYIYRGQLKGDFQYKLDAMNKATEKLIQQND